MESATPLVTCTITSCFVCYESTTSVFIDIDFSQKMSANEPISRREHELLGHGVEREHVAASVRSSVRTEKAGKHVDQENSFKEIAGALTRSCC